MKLNIHANPTAEKHEAYNAATALLKNDDSSSLRYAALELRRCIEAIVYQKLTVYGELLPEESVHQWQPPQAFDALIEIEPTAEESRRYLVGRQTEPARISEGSYHAIGTDERPKAKWIKKTWNKLGFYLHAEWPFAMDRPKTSVRPFLEKTLKELAPLVNNSFTAMTSTTIGFKCSGCGGSVKVIQRAVEVSRKAACLECGIEYRAEIFGDDFKFFPNDPPVTCECGMALFIPVRNVRVGHKFACKDCSRKFEIVGFDWKYTVEDPPKTETKPSS